MQIDTFHGMTGRGITQTYVGDLLVVNNAQNEVLRSTYGTPPLFPTLSSFITTNLNGPVGVAKAPSLREVFVSNSNSSKHLPGQPAVSIFDSTGALAAAPCSGLTLPNGNKQVPDYLASAPTANATNTVINDALYLVTNSNTAGTLWTWNTAQGNCNLVQVASIGTAVTGVAVAPAPVTLMLPVSATAANPTPTIFNFNSSLFQLTATGCTASVTAYPLSQATINSMINLARKAGGDTNAVTPLGPYPVPLTPPQLLDSAVQAPGLGDAGFEIAYVAHWFFPPPAPPSCTSVFPDGGFVTGISNFEDSGNFTNPRSVQCDNSDPATEPQLDATTTCGSPAPVGVYPLGGPIPGDSSIKYNSVFAPVNELAGAGTVEPGQFCGFQPPLSNAQPPALAGTFSSSGSTTVNVKFKLSAPAGNCKKDFITDAVALISVAKIQNPDGTAAFSAINVQSTSSSLDQPPIFNSGNQQYSFTLNLRSIFAQAGAGTYSITVTFLSDNTTNQSILIGLTQ